MKYIKFLLIVIVGFLLACNNQQQKTDKDMSDDALLVENATVEGEKEGGNEPQSVEDFVKEAASGGMMEVELGMYAQQNASSARVKNFGSMMVRDHGKANEELKSIVSAKNIQVPSSMEDKHMKKVNDLKQKSGAEFDSEYMKEMVDDHQKDVETFSKQAEDGQDSEIKSFASRTLPVLRMHLDSARSIHEALNNN